MYTESHPIRISQNPTAFDTASGAATSAGSRLRRFFVGPHPTHTIHRHVPRIVTEDERRAMVPTIRSLLRSEGQIHARRDGLEWTSDLDIVRVDVAVEGGATNIEVRGDARLDLFASYGAPVVFLLLLAFGLGLATAMGWRVVMAVIAPSAWGIGRLAWQFVGHRFERKLRTLTNRLVEQSRG